MRHPTSIGFLPYCLLFLLGLGVGGIIGSFYEPSGRAEPQDSPPLASASIEMALAVAERDDEKQSAVLVRQAIRRAGHDPESFLYVWNGIQEIEKRFGTATPLYVLRQELLTALESAMLDADTRDEFRSLYRLHAVVQEATEFENAEVPKETPEEDVAEEEVTEANDVDQSSADSQEAHQPTATPLALMQAGLASLEEGNEERAEFLVQTALLRQHQNVAEVSQVWDEYKRYIDSHTLVPYDRFARLSSYLDSIETTVLACHDLPEFELVWGVREDVVHAQTKAHAGLLQHVVAEFSDLKDRLETTTDSSGWREAVNLLATEAEEAKNELMVVLAMMPNNGQSSDGVQSSVREFLDAAIGLASTEAAAFQERTEAVADAEANGGAVGPTDDEAGVGECERIIRETDEILQDLDALDFFSWIELLTLSGEQESGTESPSETGQLANRHAGVFGEELERIAVSLEESQMRAANIQYLRYNHWALRIIYGAETSANWDNVLGRIEVGLLHPTVNALYAMTYDALFQSETDASIRTRRVQNILNAAKLSLAAF